ncbi:hypothetical protein KCP70_13620 [Salmonella enterica subsp. enterica]|nr:hypothetical protein KCP70_13620 [Salmonella enterica subsp. enterica]
MFSCLRLQRAYRRFTRRPVCTHNAGAPFAAVVAGLTTFRDGFTPSSWCRGCCKSCSPSPSFVATSPVAGVGSIVMGLYESAAGYRLRYPR